VTVLFDYNRYMYVRGNALNMVDPTGHCPHCDAWELFAALGNDMATNTAEVISEIMPDMYETQSSVGISIVMDGEYGRSTYYDFETNRIHDARNISVGISAPGGHVDTSRSFTWFDDDDNIDSYRALNGTSHQWSVEVGPVVAGSVGYERTTAATTHPGDMMTSFIIGGGVAPDYWPYPEPNFAGVVTWIPEENSHQYDSNASMVIGVIQHRIEKGQANTLGGVVETIFIVAHAWVK